MKRQRTIGYAMVFYHSGQIDDLRHLLFNDDILLIKV